MEFRFTTVTREIEPVEYCTEVVLIVESVFIEWNRVETLIFTWLSYTFFFVCVAVVLIDVVVVAAIPNELLPSS